MQTPCNDKVTFTYPPCKAPGVGQCKDYADDEYDDPCYSSDDITDKDVAILLEEERARAQKQRKEKDDQNDLKNKDGLGSGGNGLSCNKKRVCRKVTKNPFYSNRLEFSSDLPPPPREPPPQFFPPVEVASSKSKICAKKKRKCKRKRDDGPSEPKQEPEEEEEDECEEEDGLGCTESVESCPRLIKVVRPKGGCKRRVDRGTCRKKVSEISISLQPRQIPALQRDPPNPSEKEELIAEKNLRMGCPVDCCAKKIRRKNCQHN